MKKIEDYLHLYLGCEVWYKDKLWDLVGVSRPYKTTDTTFVNIDLRPDGKGFRSISYLSESFTDLTLIKPILHPLSSMTEEELREVLIMHFDETSRDIASQSIVSVKKKFEVKMVSKYGTGIPYIVYNEDNIPHSDGVFSLSELNPDQFRYLLSKHFDLFGLIESGLAIKQTPL